MDEDDDREPDEIVVLKIVAIAHAEAYQDRKLKPVDVDRWRVLIASDTSLRATDHILAKADDGDPVHRLSRPGSALWLAHPTGLRVTFVSKRAAISLMLPAADDPEIDTDGFPEVDTSALAKCHELARALDAQVFVEDVEIPVWHDAKA